MMVGPAGRNSGPIQATIRMKNSEKSIVVFGAGDHAKVVIATVRAVGAHRIVGLLDDDEAKHNTDWYGESVLGGSEQLQEIYRQGCRKVVVAVGSNQARADMQRLAVEAGLQPITMIHPNAVVLPGSQIGEGSVLLPQAYVGAGADIGAGVLLSVGAMVAHDCILGDWCQLCPGARLGGHARVGSYALIGLGAAVLPRVAVGEQAVIGANAAVNRDVPDCATAVGVPARVLEK